MTPEQKALKACFDYAHFSGEVKRLTRAIGEAIEGCSGVAGRRRYLEVLGGIPIPCVDESDPTHLKEAYTPDVVEDSAGYYEPHQVWMSDSEVREYLAACPHCLAAHEAIQARKAARKSLGAAKRAITMIGRSSLKERT